MVNVKRTGRYRLTLRQFPKEADKPLVAARARLEIAVDRSKNRWNREVWVPFSRLIFPQDQLNC